MGNLQIVGIALALVLLMGIGIYWSIGSQNSSSSNNINYTCPNDQYANSQVNSTISCAHVNYLGYSNNTSYSCSITTRYMAGFALNYTVSGNGNIFLTMNFAMNVSSTSTIEYAISYGSGTAPTCNSNLAGTSITNIYSFKNEIINVNALLQLSLSARISGLNLGTTYWFDISSYAGVATFSKPQLTVIES